MKDFVASMAAYEDAMQSTLGVDFYARDLKKKHKKMRETPFLFLRATCWRWAEAAAELCPELLDGPVVPAIGDAHAGNFGLWRDADARLVWGVNDYDEAARLAYGLDLVRLCASLILADEDAHPADIADAILAGYRAGLKRPRAFVLEWKHLWLRDAFAASDGEREEFWAKLKRAEPAAPSDPMRHALIAALPDPAPSVVYARRSAGAGSRGRARFVAFAAAYRGGPVAIEAKALLPSCWESGREAGLAGRLARGRWRSPDPLLAYDERYVVRRLAPNNRKLDLGEARASLRSRLIAAMGCELACVHAGLEPVQPALTADLRQRPSSWLRAAGMRVARWTAAEFAAFERSGA